MPAIAFIRSNGSTSPVHCLKRHESGRVVVLRPVELDAARDPRPRQPDQGRLYDLIVVEKVIAANLVKAPQDPSAESRDDF